MRKRSRIAILLLAAAIGFGGCQQSSEEADGLATPTVAAEITPIATSTPTLVPTNTPTPESTSTPVPTATPSPEPTPVPEKTEDNLTGLTAFEITSQMIVGWNLGNTLDSTSSNTTFDTAPGRAVKVWGNEEPTRELFEAVKAAGFNTVRIPTTWYQHIKYDSQKGKYIINEDWLAYVKQTVDYAYELDMFVILNAHHEAWADVPVFTDETYETAAKIIQDLWTGVAETFADYDQHLIFEAMNEPRQTGLGHSVEWGGGDTESRAYINKLNQVFVSTIRGEGSKANRERLLMLPAYGASSDSAAVESIAVPADGGNIALSVHAYTPYFFTADTSEYANHEFPGTSGYGENYAASLDKLFRELKQISQEKNVPVIIGEFGASDFGNTDSRARWIEYYLGLAKDAGIPCVIWDNQIQNDSGESAYGLLYRATNTWFPNAIPVIQAMMKVYGQESVLPEYKEYVKPAFDWGNIPIADDWVELYRSETGESIDAWGNLALKNWKGYVSREYAIVVVYDSEAEPYMVLQGGWHKVIANEVSSHLHLLRFTYEDVEKTLTTENIKLGDMYNFFVSASRSPLVLYGVYAVPVE